MLIWNITPRCFYEFVCETSELLKNKLGCDTFCIFLLNKTCWACLLGLGLKFIFHWNVQLLIFLSSFAETLISWTAEKNDVSSANSLTTEVKLSGKLFI